MGRVKTNEDVLYYVGIALLVTAGLVVFVLEFFDLELWPCMIHVTTGFYCPGCGGTRAVSALLAGHPLSATWYHPLVTYTVVIFGGFMLTQTLARLHIGGIKGWKFHEWHLYAAVAIMIGNFILKNILLLGFHISL